MITKAIPPEIEGMITVTKDVFYAAIGELNVHPRIMNEYNYDQKFGYISNWYTQDSSRTLVGITNGGTTFSETRYMLTPKTKEDYELAKITKTSEEVASRIFKDVVSAISAELPFFIALEDDDELVCDFMYGKTSVFSLSLWDHEYFVLNNHDGYEEDHIYEIANPDYKTKLLSELKPLTLSSLHSLEAIESADCEKTKLKIKKLTAELNDKQLKLNVWKELIKKIE